MYPAYQLLFKYLRYQATASNGKGHGMHSPFVFDFITRVLNDKTAYPAYAKVEALRRQLTDDQAVLAVEDLGAGSVKSASSRRSVSSIARHAAKPKKFGQLLYRIARYYQPQTLVELGTSLGISTAYLSLACPGSRLFSFEGAAAVAARARQHFQQLQLSPISLIEGNFDEQLAPALQQLEIVDFAFLDGNHRKEPTLRYFETLLPKTNNDSILIFDDIHWSREMEEAWATVKAHPATRCTIDLFFIGIVFFRQEFKEKRHFTVRF